jgi:GT2 family glycosyltransferase
MSEVHLCIPVLKRYDKLKDLLTSLHSSTVKPDVIHVIDNGQAPRRLEWACRESTSALDLYTPTQPMGVAESWNWFVQNTPDERIISNDDVLYAPQSLERMIATSGIMVAGLVGQAFSCFLLRDECIEKVGFFDEEISPGYAYFEDCDYEQRMRDAGVYFVHCEDSGVTHAKSSTLEALGPHERKLHTERFLVAQANYLKKWGKMPEGIEEQKVYVVEGGAR